MENEKRLDLINRRKLLAEMDKFANPMPNQSGHDFLCGISTAITEIENALTVDAVEVVRCKDCKHSEPCGESRQCLHPFGLNACDGNDFCSYGERRKIMTTKICAACGCPYVGASCPNCGSREVEENEDDHCDD